MPEMTCPHCGALNADAGAFCEACGKALPAVVPSAPRVVSEAQPATTGLARSLQFRSLAKETKKAATALLWVAILQVVFGTFLVLAGRDLRSDTEQTIVLTIVYAVAALYLALYFWARRQPFPAAIAGLLIFVTLHAAEAALDPTNLGRGILMKVIVVVILARAIMAGAKQRRLGSGEA